jgi:RNA polymerase sigma-70 factor (ECF subfamily)
MFVQQAQAVPTRSKRAAPRNVPADDLALIERMAAGDRLAIDVFYARYSLKVYRFVLSLVGNPSAAEDIANEVFLDAWRQAGRFEGRAAVSTWLLAIARFKAYAAIRRRPDEALDEEQAAAIEDEADGPEEAYEKQSRSEILRRCLSRLSAENREIINLVYYHEKSVAEVAEIVGIPQNTVKTRMFYARKKLAALATQAGLDRDWL